MSSHNPTIIVVVPTYNEKDNLSSMIEALFTLHIPNFHIQTIDGNTFDGTGDDYATYESYPILISRP